MLAFRAAVAAGVDYIETDVHSSSDGVAVLSHDADLRRLAGIDKRVDELTFAELSNLDLGRGEGFCSLDDALGEFAVIRFNIDIKAQDAVEPTVRAIREAGAVDRVLVTSFNEGRRSAAARALPGVASSASAGRFVPALLAGKLGMTGVMKLALRGLVAVQVPERGLGMRITTPRIVRQLHALGVEMHVWTVNDPGRMRELLELGIDGLVTDRADLALAVVEEFRNQH
ncbi:MAG: glycerophosphodiester phosphodiesterase [Salinibacterium sp.]|nr:MAG: glycerophosphodiester phosphodiesterase [Salinibacterium sp.]